MKVAVTGSSGLIGSALVRALRGNGHEVLRLVRREAQAADEVRWDPARGEVDAAGLAGLDAAVHLAGAGVGDHRLTASYKRTFRDSRVDGTRTLSNALARLQPRPEVLISGSAIGRYGDTGDRPVDESAPPAQNFIARVTVEWEAATAPAREAGIRVVHIRSGLVLSRAGGALGRMLPIFRLGLGGRIGSGRQYWSFISLEDEVRAIQFLLETPTVSGAANLTAPHPATNAEMTAALGKVLHRPTVLPVPAFALRIALGEFANDVTGSQHVIPRALLDAGFSFRHPDVDSAVRAAVGAGPSVLP